MDLWISKLGSEYLCAAGCNPTALATMFEKLESMYGKKPRMISKLFADHREEYLIGTSEFNSESVCRLVDSFRSLKG